MTAPVYWDASAILSLLAPDRQSKTARRQARQTGPHLISSLAFAEVSAVVSRLERGERISPRTAERHLRALASKPWSALHLQPDRRVVAELSSRHPLRGPDLWHLAVAKTLASELPELAVLTFDSRLAEAARAEGL